MKIRLPYPHAGQITVRREARRFNYLSAGRRWRKTTLGMTLAIENALRGITVIWTAPTFDQVRVSWNESKYACQDADVEFVQQRMTATMPNGVSIVYRSLDDPDNARGHSAGLVLIDEVADVKPDAWHGVLRPMLIDNGGDAWLFGTPKGRNWFYQEYMRGLDREDSMCWQIPTVGCEVVNGRLVRKPNPYENPDIPFEEIQNAFETTPLDLFKQEYLAEFVDNAGAVFRNIRANLYHPATNEIEKHKGHHIIAGVDWAKQQDYTAISVGCATCKREIYHDRFNKIDYALQKERIKGMVKTLNIQSILVELNSIGQPMMEMLQRENLPVSGFNTTASTKPPLIENLALALEKEEWKFIDDPTWTGELQAYEQKVNQHTNRSTYSAPEGMHDDTVIARALMLRLATSGSLILFGA